MLQSAVPGGICRQCTDYGLQAVHCSRSDHFCRQKDGADGLGPNARRQKISQQVYLQQYERPGKGYIIESKSGLFLAEVGTSAGKNLVATFQESGLLMFGVGAAITLIPMLVAAIVGRLVFKISLLDLLGTITGGMTSTPGLAAADSMVDSNIPSVAYATVYPIAMVFLILFIQIIASAVY